MKSTIGFSLLQEFLKGRRGGASQLRAFGGAFGGAFGACRIRSEYACPQIKRDIVSRYERIEGFS